MLTSSAKQKGRKFQQWVRDQLIEELNVHHSYTYKYKYHENRNMAS
jgi:prophage antirepressor-like protein